MGISFNKVCRYFSEKLVNINVNDNFLAMFNDAKLLTKNQTVFPKDIIYIGKASMLMPDFKYTEDASLILINDTGISIKTFFANNINIIELEDTEDIFEIYNHARDLFTEDIEIDRQSAVLLKSAIVGNGLDSVVNVASDILGNPVIVIDTSYKVLANSNIDQITDHYWRENIKRGYCSYDFIAEVQKMKSVQNGIKSQQPYKVYCKGSPILRLVSSIFIDNKYVGSIILLSCNKPFSQRDSELLVLAGQIAAEEMKKNSFYRNTNNIVYEELIYDILEGSLSDKDKLRERIKSAHLKFSKHLSVLLFDISKYNSSGKQHRNLTEAFSTFFPLTNSIYYKNNIVAVYDNEKDNVDLEGNTQLKEFLTANSLCLGISREFSRIEECRKHYDQAAKAITVGQKLNPQNPVFHYANIQFYDLLSSAYESTDHDDLIHPALIKLKNYDKFNKTDFYNTLYVYMKNNQNIQKTSDELFIHRNTTRYRIQKILELIKTDISDSENFFNIYMAYKVDKFIEKNNC